MPETGSAARAVRGLTLGVLTHAQRAKEQRELEGLSEIEELVKVDVVGRAEEFPIWTQVHLEFETVFIDAAGQLDTEFDEPHFTYGAVVTKGGPLGLVACVTKWDKNDRGEVTGCILGISAISTDHGRKFQGELHARFKGYGMPADIYGGLGEQLDSE
jgi:hypothetical protein